MVEIRYGDQYEIADLAGQTVSEAREQFRAEFGIPDKARAKLNGQTVKEVAELDTMLNDDDQITFAVTRGYGAYLVGALLLAMAATGGVFAFGFINATATLTAIVYDSNFADVYLNPDYTSCTWTGYGFYKGAISGPTKIFNVVPYVDYTGDLVVTVSIGNADQLAKIYRVLALKMDLVNASTDVPIDINEDGIASGSTDWVMLTLDNGSVSMFPDGTTDNMAVRVKSGFYITHVRPLEGWSGAPDPDLFCEVAQR